jgi:hypothetical protein
MRKTLSFSKQFEIKKLLEVRNNDVAYSHESKDWRVRIGISDVVWFEYLLK